VQALLDPQLIVFGGGLGSRPDVLSAVRASLDAHGTPAPALRISALGDRAGIVGALEVASAATSSREREPRCRSQTASEGSPTPTAKR
jgi:hypothetical protein